MHDRCSYLKVWLSLCPRCPHSSPSWMSFSQALLTLRLVKVNMHMHHRTHAWLQVLFVYFFVKNALIAFIYIKLFLFKYIHRHAPSMIQVLFFYFLLKKCTCCIHVFFIFFFIKLVLFQYIHRYTHSRLQVSFFFC